MRNKILGSLMLMLLLVSMYAITYRLEFKVPPVVFANSSSTYKESWVDVSVTNTHENMTTSGDIKMTVSSTEGVNIAWSTNITEYFKNIAYWNDTQGYKTYMEWLNGTGTLPYHWGDMDWYVSEGSLTSITWDEIKYWWNMYSDTGGSVGYETFMDNTYMADCNLTDPTNDPDIIGVVPWNGNNITVKDLVVPANTTVHIVFKIVITEPGAYDFDLTSPNPLLDISPSTWRSGGVKTILVPYEYSTIQAAIAAAVAGDTVLVGSGTYNERLVIDKQLNLTGSGAATIVRPTDAPAPGVYDVEIDASGTIIQNFLFDFNDFDDTRGGQGIVVGDMNEPPVTTVQILDNIIYTGDGSGVGGTGIQTGKYCDVSGLLIQGNIFYGDASGMGEGVYVNPYDGTDSVTIHANEFYGNLFSGVSIEASNVTASNNVINSNVTKGYYGVRLMDMTGGQTYNGVNISNNIITNLTYGVRIGTSSDLGSNLTATIIYNNITGNDVGIWVRYGAYLTDSVHYNNIAGNTNYGIDNAGGERSVAAGYNWWGNETGPQHSVFNPLGTGDSISDKVDFKPWLIQPYPPAVPVSELYVSPELAQCWTGFNETFEVKVVLANVQLLYGLDFKLTWDPTLLDLVFASYTELWGSYPDTYPWQDTINNTLGRYHLALSGTGDVTPFDGNATLATLTFNITSEPIYPANFTSDLALVDTLLTSTKNLTEPEPILHVVYNGTYMCNSTLPKIALGQSIYTVDRTPYDPETGGTKKFDVDIKVSDVVNLEAFDFNLTYDPYLLKFGNAWEIHVACADGWVVWNDTKGSVFGHAYGISPLVNGTVTIATVKFQVRRGFVWNTVNGSRSCPLEFSYTSLTRPGDVVIEHEAINGTYRYKPVPGDLDMSGAVNIIDLAAAAHAFGLSSGDPGWDEYWFANVYVDDTINILDIVIIARNFGRTEPEP